MVSIYLSRSQKPTTMNNTEIIEKQPNRSPFLFIEKIIDLSSEHCLAKLKLQGNEWYFDCHWPGNPNMPATLQLEAMSQTASLILFQENECPSFLYLAQIRKSIFRKKIMPGVDIIINVELIRKIKNIYEFNAKITNNEGRVYSSAVLSLVKPIV